MLTRALALDLVKNHVSKKTIVYHMIAVEAMMSELATCLAEDEEKWGLTACPTKWTTKELRRHPNVPVFWLREF